MELQSILDHFEDVSEEADGGYIMRCPNHSDSRPSLRFWVGDNAKGRLSCRAGCDNSDIVKASGLKWPAFFDITGVAQTVPTEKPKLITGAPVAALAMYVDRTSANYGYSGAQTYAYDRFGISSVLAAELELGFDSGEGFKHTSPAFDRHPRLTVPLKNFDGNPHGLQGRDLSGNCPARWLSLKNPDGFRWGQYGVFRCGTRGDTVLVTEGPGDALTAVGAGYDAVAIRGAALAGTQELLAELAVGLRGMTVIAAGDNDSAGQAFNRKLAAGLKPFGVDVYALPIPDLGPKTDLSDWRESNPAQFKTKLAAAVRRAELAITEEEGGTMQTTYADRVGTAPVSADDGVSAAAAIAAMGKTYGGNSDAANAHAIVAWTEGRIRYAKGLGFFVYNGRTWDRGEVRVRQEIHRMGAALVMSGALDMAKGFTFRSRIDDLLAELRSVPSVYVEPDAFDTNPDILSFRNGVVELPTGRLRPHDKEDMITVSLDLDYNPDADASRWEAFVNEIMPGMPEMVAYLQRLVGYGITGHTSEQCFSVLWGKGANGKSVFTETLTDIFSSVTTTTPFSTFEQKPSGGISNDLAALKGARLVMASEGESGKEMSEAILKRVTGKDRVTARFMRAEYFTFQPTFLIMLATNHKPNFRSQDEGLWRRVKLIPFKRYLRPEERDYGLQDKLLREREGIVAWAVRGARRWYEDGGLHDPEAIRDATKDYRETSDTLSGFAPGVYEITQDDADTVLGTTAFNDYLDWCEAENLPQKERLRRTSFYRLMEERNVSRKRLGAGITLIGIRKTVQGPEETGPGIFGKPSESPAIQKFHEDMAEIKDNMKAEFKKVRDNI